MNAKSKKLMLILSELYANDEKVALKAIKSLEVHGDSSVIKPLAEYLLTSKSKKLEKEVVELLSSLKDTSVCVEIMDVLADQKFRSIRHQILSAIWNTKVDFSSYIDDFVQIAVEGDFMDTLDCLTIIENMDGPFMEEDILESQLHLKNYLEDNKPKDEQKAMLLSEIAIIIKDINESLMD